MLLDAIIDTAKTLPFLFGAYLLLEWLAHKAGGKSKERLRRFGHLGPIGGAILGLFPQCGFSVAAANFYADRVITPGTLLAVFLATSDEAVPILLAPDGAAAIVPLLAVKTAVAVVAGFFADLAMAPLWRRRWERDSELRHTHIEGHGHRHDDGREDDSDEHCHHNHCNGGLFKTAMLHTLKVAALIFVITFALDFALEILGEKRTAALLLGGSRLQPVAAALFGLIPSCAVSVFLANLYREGAVTFGSVVAGLSTGAGMGTLVLVQACRSRREASFMIALLFAIGAATGLVIDFLL
ncbi:MAG: arsenic efflux protein [Kiritimatiellae bacterium]|nr:arsenic efflux protein [Kiritimatiellia bacterium]